MDEVDPLERAVDDDEDDDDDDDVTIPWYIISCGMLDNVGATIVD